MNAMLIWLPARLAAVGTRGPPARVAKNRETSVAPKGSMARSTVTVTARLPANRRSLIPVTVRAGGLGTKALKAKGLGEPTVRTAHRHRQVDALAGGEREGQRDGGGGRGRRTTVAQDTR